MRNRHLTVVYVYMLTGVYGLPTATHFTFLLKQNTFRYTATHKLLGTMRCGNSVKGRFSWHPVTKACSLQTLFFFLFKSKINCQSLPQMAFLRESEHNILRGIPKVKLTKL